MSKPKGTNNKKDKRVKPVLPELPNRTAIEKRTGPILQQATVYTITSLDHYTAAKPYLDRLDAAIEWLKSIYDPFVAAHYGLHKWSCEQRNDAIGPFEAAKKHVLLEISTWDMKTAAENKRKAEAAARLLQAEQKKDLVTAAKRAERQGDEQAAAELRELSGRVPMPAVAVEQAPRLDGVVKTERWVAVIEDAHLVPREYCEPSQALLNLAAKQFGDTIKIAGVRIEKVYGAHTR
ncbi:MAG: hypothetical protein HRJ53_03025 [Acidobacteria bacterium Pan2503]|uniref:Uncharacterized protein n=1 Tax=Candidatus Acidiferrum panamense TaxID=2741543 RepID=A0A7V8NM86_9BACT|nr:hypothetical protein [Candidatus Acidoferrum panamensis]